MTDGSRGDSRRETADSHDRESVGSEGDEQMMMTSSTRQRRGAEADRGRDMFTGAIQWEMLSEEERPLLLSHFVSSGLGLMFLMLVLFGPHPVATTGSLRAEPRMRFDLGGLVRESELLPEDRSNVARAAGGSRGASSRVGSQREQGADGGLAAAFRGAEPGGMVGLAAGALEGVQTSSGTGYNGLATVGAGRSDKATLGSGGSGGGSRGSGRGGIGDGSSGGSGIGGVGGGGGVSRSVVSASVPSVIAPPLSGPGRDVRELGSTVRDRQAVLQSCYTREGLAVNPKLAGTIDVAITIDGAGGVNRVAARARSMSGPGTSQVLSCIENQVQRWKFPASEGSGTYSFPFSFTS